MEPGALARNMSVMPRTTLTFTALAPASGGTGDRVADGTGLAFVCRLDLGALVPDSCRRAVFDMHKHLTPLRQEERLRLALVYARTEAAAAKRAPRGVHAEVRAMPIEAAADALRDLIAAESLAEAGLPRVGLVMQSCGGEHPTLSSLRRTLAILTRRRGSLFLRDSDPIVWSALDVDVFDLWTTVVPSGRPA